MRKKISQRGTALLLAACMGLTACSSAPSSTTEPGTSDLKEAAQEAVPEEADPYSPLSEKLTLHVGRSENSNAEYLPGENSADNYLVRYISEKLNVEYVQDFSVDSGSYDTKASMAIASGTIPDVMVVNGSQLRQLAMAEAVEDMSGAFNKFASDHLKAAYETTDGISFDNATFDGKLLGMPNISPGADGIPMLFLRGDWMEALGLEAPETVEDIAAIVKAFKENYNTTSNLVVSQKIVSDGGNNTYGIDALFALYDSYPKHWIDDGQGNLVYGSNTPETKEALAEIRKLVENGVIDTSFIVRDSDQCAELITSGQAGAFFGAWWNMSWPLNNMLEEDSSVYWNAYLAPLGENGKYNTSVISPSSNYLVVKKGAPEAVKEAVIKTMNYQFDIDQDQGKSLKANPEDPYSWTSMPLSLLLSTYDDKEVKAQNVMAVINGKMEASELTGEAKQWYESYKEATEDLERAIAEKNLSGWAYVRTGNLLAENEDLMNKVIPLTWARTDTMDSKWATLTKLEDETFLQILNGDLPIDAFDRYVEKWNSLGGSQITAELAEISGK